MSLGSVYWIPLGYRNIYLIIYWIPLVLYINIIGQGIYSIVVYEVCFRISPSDSLSPLNSDSTSGGIATMSTVRDQFRHFPASLLELQSKLEQIILIVSWLKIKMLKNCIRMEQDRVILQILAY